MVCTPTDNVLVVRVIALLVGNDTGAPRGLLPSRNVTEPVGAGAPAGGNPVPPNAAVNVTACPAADGFADEERPSEVEILPAGWPIANGENDVVKPQIVLPLTVEGMFTVPPLPKWNNCDAFVTLGDVMQIVTFPVNTAVV
jgi:hypothetical protein